jgi:hypothetical protein
MGCMTRQPTETSPPIVLACAPSALEPDIRAQHFTWIRDQLPELVQEVSELSDGIALRLPAAALPALAEFIDRERRCCPFLRFELVVGAGEESVWLRLKVPNGVKEFLAHVLHLGNTG